MHRDLYRLRTQPFRRREYHSGKRGASTGTIRNGMAGSVPSGARGRFAGALPR